MTELAPRLRQRLDRLRDDILAANAAGSESLKRTVRSRLSTIITAVPGSPGIARARSVAEAACLALLSDIAWASEQDVARARDVALTALDALDSVLQDAG